MRHIAIQTNLRGLSVCWSRGHVSPGKRLKPIEMPFAGFTRVGPKTPGLDPRTGRGTFELRLCPDFTAHVRIGWLLTQSRADIKFPPRDVHKTISRLQFLCSYCTFKHRWTSEKTTSELFDHLSLTIQAGWSSFGGYSL